MVSLVEIALRTWQFVWTLLAMSLIGNVIADAFAGNPSSINYAMFTATFSMIVVLYGLVAIFLETLASPIVLLIVDGLATIFTFIAGVVLAAKLHVHSCTNQSYLRSNSLTNGAHNRTERCRELQASCAFFWFLFAGYIASMVFTSLNRRGSGMSSRRGGVHRSMSHV